MQDFQAEVTKLVSALAAQELEKFKGTSLPTTARQIAINQHRRHLAGWAAKRNISEIAREAQKASTLLPDRVVHEFRNQAAVAARNVTPNALRIRASNADPKRAHAYFLAETWRSSFMSRVLDQVIPLVNALAPETDVAALLDAVKMPGAEREAFLDAGSNVRPFHTGWRSMYQAIRYDGAEVVEGFGWDVHIIAERLKAVIPAGTPQRILSVIAYGFDQAGVPQRDVHTLTVGGEEGAALKHAYVLEGWGDRVGEVVLPVGPLFVFEERNGLPRSAPLPSMPVVVDRLGNRHQLLDGAAAAAQIQADGVPSIRFAQSDAMHAALDEMGVFENVDAKQSGFAKGYRCLGEKSAMYVVYDESPVSGKFRTVCSWHPGQHAAEQMSLSGWGDGPEDVVLPQGREAISEAFSQSYLAKFSALAYGGMGEIRSFDAESALVAAVRERIAASYARSGESAPFSIQGMEVRLVPPDSDDNYLTVEVDVQTRVPFSPHQARHGLPAVLQEALQDTLRPSNIEMFRLKTLSVTPIELPPAAEQIAQAEPVLAESSASPSP